MDSPDSSPSSKLSSPRHAILQRLAVLGVPPDYLHELQPGIVAFVRENRSLLSEIVAAMLPTDAQVSSLRKQSRKDDEPAQKISKFKTLLSESLLWLRWLMFLGNPEESLKILSEKATGKRAVCGAVWGQNDLAYRCRTCEQDPTCAICVPCFLDGDHNGHDYSIIYTGGGCCDCGDATAWKREGFCSRHKGVEQIEVLPAELACSMGPVLDALFIFWRQKIFSVQLGTHSRQADTSDANRRSFALEFSSSVADMLLEFSVCSESLLSFISKRMCACDGLLEIIVRAERFMLEEAFVKKLIEMLLKFLGEPVFKYNFAKVFIGYYPLAVSEAIKETSPNYLETHPLVPTFSVQIFTVPNLTPRLVHEENLLDVLFGCLRDLFNSCLDEVGQLQANKLASLYAPTCRLIEDIRYIMSHQEVPKYIICEQPDILRTWMRLLTVVQGMDPQKRAMTVHTEDDNDDLQVPFFICFHLGNVNAQLTEGAFSVEPSIVDSVVTEANPFGLSLKSEEVDSNGGKSRFLWLIFECLMAIDNWLAPQSVSRGKSVLFTEAYIGSLNMRLSRKKLCVTKSSGTGNMLHGTPFFREADNDEDDDSATNGQHKSPMSSFTHCSYTPNDGGGDEDEDIGTSDMRDERASTSGAIEETSADMECDTEEAFSLLSLAEWQEIVYDVSSQEISFHIPLHRFLSLLLRKTMKSFYGGMNLVELEKTRARGLHQQDFFAYTLMGCHPCGFASSVMEHPLRLRVFCAQVRSGMWRKNGDASILSYEWYRSVGRFEQGMESDLFMLQCCAALAPPELFVHRIQERFGLSSYTALDLGEYNEYEAVLVQDMLSLLIQIVKERRFCGSSIIDNLKRELVNKLAIWDATHSQLVKALPRDLSKSDQLQSVLDMLAVYSNPSGMRQGNYSLRKEFWSELDLYHPQWTPRDLQVAEERYLHICRVPALNAQIPQWTNIFDPLAGISRIATSKAAFLIVRSVLFYALYTDKPTRSRAPDGLLITALHLLYLALDVCEKHHSQINGGGSLSDPSHSLVELTPNCSFRSAQDFYPVLTSACEKFDVNCADSSWKHESTISLLVALMKKFKEESRNNDAETRLCNISSLIESLLKKFAKLSSDCMSELKLVAPEVLGGVSQHSSSNTGKDVASTADCEERKVKARERQAAILAKMKAEQSKFMASLEASNEEEDKSVGKKVVHASKKDLPEDAKPICSLCRDTESTSPLCYLVLVQKSQLLSLVEKCPPSWEDIGGTEKKIQRSGSEGRLRSSGFDQSVPLNQVQPHIGRDPSFADVAALWDFFKGRLSDSDTRSTQESDLSFDDSSSSSSFEMVENDIYHLVLQDIHSIETADAQTQSTIADPVCSNMKNKESSIVEEGKSSKLYQSLTSSFQHNSKSSSRSMVYSAKRRGFGPKDCDGIHISSCGHAVHQDCHDRYLLSLKQRYSRRLVFEGGHIVEPDKGEFLCPLCRRFTNSILPVAAGIGNAFGENMTCCSSSLYSLDSFGASNRHLPYALSLIKSAAKFVGEDRYLSILSGKLNDNFEPALEPILRKLCMLYYSQLDDSLPASNRQSSSLLIWDTLKYALLSAEVAARGRWITYPSGSGPQTSLSRDIQSNWFVLLLLLHVAQSTRSLNSQEVLLRFKGIQLMARSICNGVSEDGLCLKTDDKRGTFLKGASYKEVNFPDIQFWRQAADPILAHDPFSSLVWALFCLPLPFLSSGETFISLVHLFYIVCVVQGLVTCYSKQSFDRSYFSSYILHDICNMMAASEVVNQFFVSNFIDCSWHPKDMIRRLTFPYLRRCLLLWKLLKSSKSSFHDSFEKWDGLGSYISDGTDCNTKELNGIKEIEDLFQIQPPQVVLNDGLVCSLASKWCEHFLREFTERKCGGVLHSTSAVPFRLMQLPKLYQDLLQRCIKLQCSECKSVPDEPALCLLCGKLCSPNWKSCCSASRCRDHAMVCGAGIGIFLLVRKTTIVLRRSTRQALWPSPYLDAFGEEDHDMHRGRPLYLSEERYATLTNLVASHGMDQNSEVLRSTSVNLFDAD